MKTPRLIRVGLVALTMLAASTPMAVHADQSRDVHVELEGYPSKGTVASDLVNIGTVSARVDVARLHNGQARVARDRFGKAAVRLPAFRSGSTMPRAVIRVTHRASTGDPLAPRSRDFAFGAMFTVDETSTGSAVDNGNNIIQRGLASDPSQYKLELDRQRPMCRVAGSAGAVVVRSDVAVSPHKWYKAECARSGDRVTLTVSEIVAGGDLRTTVNSRTGRTGEVALPKTWTPLSIGGKLAANGAVIRSSTDQFNGVISDPFLDISG
ncbi:hypothetical protein BJF86_02370 [Serinicoccus sp. CNJ-927]|uniref:hypothetical protein n=1 Tax=Serinicoccus sp. CNJ-927 TaxID=1904970 RepID=UPI00095B76B0|nr:hypothetical protein [Serinicoccus sp. CNJ-927]OLT41873.1 hypothetical protein BJF86_02370 [Serinicoccus sp. CNJ-927]